MPDHQNYSWYLDDGVLVGSETDDLVRSRNLLCEQLGPDRRLHVRVDKCELWSTVDLDRRDIRLKRKNISDLEVLVAALGTPELACVKLSERMGKIRLLFEDLDYRDYPQGALGIRSHFIAPPKWFICWALKSPQVQLSNPYKYSTSNSAKKLRISLKLFFQKNTGLKQPCL